ncbi:MAG: hypothetical protein U1E66_03980 [Rhodospirillales bacterium]
MPAPPDGGRLRQRLKVLSLCALALLAPAGPAAAGWLDLDAECREGRHSLNGEAVYRICMPRFWNGDLVVYAHGYVSPLEPVGIPEDQLNIGGTSIEETFTRLGYAFAVTSYAHNGLAIAQGVADVTDLVRVFAAQEGEPSRVYIVGVSEGGAVATLAVERDPLTFSGGLAACGPIGWFLGQINYQVQFRVLFDYFFPGILPPSPVAVPQSVIDNWPAYEAVVRWVVTDPARYGPMVQLFRLAGVPVDVNDPEAVSDVAAHLLKVNVLGSNDAVVRLGGQPFDNTTAWYQGSDDDARLNALVQRFAADPAALQTIASFYETSGYLQRPLVTLHTTADPVVPYGHIDAYTKAVQLGSQDHLRSLAVERFGHCAFSEAEAVYAFSVLVRDVTGGPLADAEMALATPTARADYRALQRGGGTKPKSSPAPRPAAPSLP